MAGFYQPSLQKPFKGGLTVNTRYYRFVENLFFITSVTA